MSPFLFHPLAGVCSLALIFSTVGCTREKPHAAETTQKADDDHDHNNHGDHDDHEKPDAHEDHDDHDQEKAGASFDADHGLELPPDVAAALSVRTARAEMRTLPQRMDLTAQIFITETPARALALVSPEQAKLLSPGLRTTTGAELIAISRAAEKADGRVDLIFSLPSGEKSPAPAAGDTLVLSLTLAPDAPALTVPRSALLETATGTFVYIAHDHAYRRTAVTTGAASADFLEITSGLSAGDTIVTAAVTTLWLTELRLTKGGGHSH